MTQVFTISNGTSTVDLLSSTGPYYLASYETGINQWKDGGIFTSNSVSEGTTPIFRQYDSFQEKLTIHISGSSQDDVLNNLRQLLQLLDVGVNYFTEPFGTQVYMSVRGENETNTRYAIISSYKIETLPPQFTGSFVVGAKKDTTKFTSIYQDVELILTRGIWLESTPGTETSAYIGNPAQNTTTEPFHHTEPLDIRTNNLAGDVDAVGKLVLTANDAIFATDGSPTHLILGLRKTSRGSDFICHLPFTDSVSLPAGLSIPDLGGGSWVNDTDAPVSSTGRVRRVSITDGSFFWQQAIVIDESISSSFRGRFRAFLRIRNNTGISGRILARLRVHIDPVNETSTTRFSVKYPPVESNINNPGSVESLDMGIIELPASFGKVGDIGDISISVEIKDTQYVSGTTVVDIYDIGLIPADENIFEIEGQLETQFLDADTIVLDQITSPEDSVDIQVKNSASGNILFRPLYGGGQRFQIPTSRSKIWMYAFVRETTVDEFEIQYNDGFTLLDSIYTARLYKLNRYLLPRGSS